MKNSIFASAKKGIVSAVKALLSNKVVLMFLILCLFGICTTGKPLSYTVSEVFTRFGRNTFLVLALIIPVLAGLGLNFGIVVGAMAAQISIFWVVYWGFTGIGGLLLCFLISTPIAILLGYLVGRLYNKTKGSEMITGMVLGYFADGLYQFLFLFVIGGVIPLGNSSLLISGGVGVKNTIDLAGNLKYSLDNLSMLLLVRTAAVVYLAASAIAMIVRLMKSKSPDVKKTAIKMAACAAVFGLTFIPAVSGFMGTDRLLLLNAVELASLAAVVYAAGKFVITKLIQKQDVNAKRLAAIAIVAVIAYALTYIQAIYELLTAVLLPVATYALIILLCVFNRWILSTRLGQNMRTVGQSRTVANSSGIDVNKTRIIAMCISTVLAAWGQIIYLQNLGTFSTYGAHTMVGQYAIAALLVGGASVQSANNKHAILGVVLFHTLFVVAPLSAGNLFGSALIGEYFRVFVCYGVIALSLAMHAWKTVIKPKVESTKVESKPPAEADTVETAKQ